MNSRRRLTNSVLDAFMVLGEGERVLVRAVRALYDRPVFDNANLLAYLPVACLAASLGPTPVLLGMSLMVLSGVLLLLCDERARYLPGREVASAERLEQLMAPEWSARLVDAQPRLDATLRLTGALGIAGTIVLLLGRYAQLPLLMTAAVIVVGLPLAALFVIALVALATPGPGSVEMARRAVREGLWSVPALYLFVGLAIAFTMLLAGNMIFPATAFSLRGWAVISFGAGAGLVLIALSRFVRWVATHPPFLQIVAAALGLTALAVAMSMAGVALSQRGEPSHMTWTDAWRVLTFRPAAVAWMPRGTLTVGMLAPLLPVATLAALATNASAVWLLGRVVRLPPSGVGLAVCHWCRGVGTAVAWIGVALIAGGVLGNRVFSNLEKARLGLAPSGGVDVATVLEPLESRGLTVPRLVLLAQLSMWLGTPLALIGWRLRAAGNDRASEGQAPLVLYLRAFSADALTGVRYRVGLLLGMPFRTLEQDVVEQIAVLGKVVALGRPTDLLPPLGARRLYVDDDRWRETVLALMTEAVLVVIRAGDTENLRWELEQARRIVAPERFLLWFDDPDPEDGQHANTLATGIEPALGIEPIPLRPRGMRFVRFDAAWQPEWSFVPALGPANQVRLT